MVNPGDLFTKKLIEDLGYARFEVLRMQVQLEAMQAEIQSLKEQLANGDRSEA